MQEIQAKLLKENMVVTLSRSVWNITRKITGEDAKKIKVEAADGSVKHSKELIDKKKCKEFLAILDHMASVYEWVGARTMPTYFQKGFNLARLTLRPEFDEYFAAASAKLEKELLPAFLEKATATDLNGNTVTPYEAAKVQAKKDLNGFYKESDYPSPGDMPARFSIKFNYVTFGVPESLPEEIQQRERAKMEANFKEAEEKIIDALRESFSKLVDHAVKVLTVAPGEKAKKLYDSSLENVQDFIVTFNARNLMNDSALESLVKKAESILQGSPTVEKTEGRSSYA